MTIDQELIGLFKEFFDKQEAVEQMTRGPFIESYGYTELHTVDVIGKSELPNVSMIAKKLDLTRGAVSKITKRLLKKGDIERFQLETNNKEVYFQLTAQGKKVYTNHLKSHLAWENSDLSFFETIKPKDKNIIIKFMSEYLEHLDKQIIANERKEK